MGVTETVTGIESQPVLPLLLVGCVGLVRSLHVKDYRAVMVAVDELAQNPLSIAFASYLVIHGEIPEPVVSLMGIDNRKANEYFSIIISGKVQRHLISKAHKVFPRYLLFLGECFIIKPLQFYVTNVL